MHGPAGEGPVVGINVTPLVDVALVLLVIFIVTARVVVTPSLPLDLPKAANSETVQVLLSVMVSADGVVLVDGEPRLSDDELTALFQEARRAEPALRAVVHAGGEVPHRRVMHLLDLLRGAGIEQVAFATVEEGAP
jgi:biopolymer transport protein TolR